MSEREDAVRLANRILDEPGRDPDDDLSLLSRQLLRSLERQDVLLAACESLFPAEQWPEWDAHLQAGCRKEVTLICTAEELVDLREAMLAAKGVRP